jgi:hypothetical protein
MSFWNQGSIIRKLPTDSETSKGSLFMKIINIGYLNRPLRYKIYNRIIWIEYLAKHNEKPC